MADELEIASLIRFHFVRLWEEGLYREGLLRVTMVLEPPFSI
jgi:hypothetical protein